MAIELKQAQAIEAKVKSLCGEEDLKVKIVPGENEVVVISRRLTLRGDQLKQLVEAARGHTFTFGRSGANFRMIIW